MRIVERQDIDIKRWDALVFSQSKTTVFSSSFYLDAVAENWCVYVDESYSRGIALPYVIRLGNRNLYNPIFFRYVEWLGEPLESFEELDKLLKTIFKSSHLCLRENLFNSKQAVYVFQEVNTIELHSQAKRALKKYQKHRFQIQKISDIDILLNMVVHVLEEKVDAFSSSNVARLKQLLVNLKSENKLIIYGVFLENKLLGGLFLMETKNRVIYLKGGVEAFGKQNGAMYQLMFEAITDALSKNKVFDFGGSRVEGVRKFNLNFGGIDQTYYPYLWDNSPFFHKVVKQVYRKIKKG
jgi:hypothetical protein